MLSNKCEWAYWLYSALFTQASFFGSCVGIHHSYYLKRLAIVQASTLTVHKFDAQIETRMSTGSISNVSKLIHL